ncbi:MAG: hypothetical protein JO247_03630 [Chloroflexi bacterium]|nr:hypothetical protein [Chloroflexota bacterium]
MSERDRAPLLNRRQFIGVGGSAAAAALLAACGGTASVASTAPSSTPPSSAPAAASGAAKPSASVAAQAAASGGAKVAGPYPTYIPIQGGPKPDYAASGPQYDDAFDKYPANPQPVWKGDPPGTGSNVSIMSIALFPPPTPYDQNPAWKAVNKALNANVQFQVVTAADYPVKLAASMAGDMPDMVFMYPPATANAPSALMAAPGVPQFLQSQCADLTPYLAGDSAKDYPFLAAIPTQAWQYAGTAYQGKLYMVPIHRYLPQFLWLKNTEMWDKELGTGYVPKDGDDLKRVMKQLTKPPNVYAIGAAQGGALWLPTISAIFGAPNDWKVDASGKLIKNWETDEFKEATGYVRDLWTSGVYHPNSTNYASGVVARADFAGGKFAMFFDPINGWQDSWRQSLTLFNPPHNVGHIGVFSAHAGLKPGHFFQGANLWATAVKKGSPDRVKEMLRILNFLAVPFGSAEDQLLTFGVKDTDYTLDKDGNPQLTKAGNGDANYVPWKYVTQHPFVFFTPDIPNYAKTMVETEKAVIPYGVANPTWGLASNTALTKGVALNQAVNDGLNDIVLGRRPLSDYDQLIKDWVSGGGDTIRKEFMDAIAASK